MRNSYSIPLYDIYKKARDWRITVDEYDKLAEKTDNRMCEIGAELIGLEQPDESDEMTISNLLNLAKTQTSYSKVRNLS